MDRRVVVGDDVALDADEDAVAVFCRGKAKRPLVARGPHATADWTRRRTAAMVSILLLLRLCNLGILSSVLWWITWRLRKGNV
jgi:hypothetical protein